MYLSITFWKLSGKRCNWKLKPSDLLIHTCIKLIVSVRKQQKTTCWLFCWDADHVCWYLVVWCVLWVYMFVFSINFFHTVRFSSISSRNDSSSLHKSYVWMYLHSHVMIDIPAFGTVMALGHLVTVSSTSFEMKMKIWMDFLDPSVQSEGDFL